MITRLGALKNIFLTIAIYLLTVIYLNTFYKFYEPRVIKMLDELNMVTKLSRNWLFSSYMAQRQLQKITLHNTSPVIAIRICVASLNIFK